MWASCNTDLQVSSAIVEIPHVIVTHAYALLNEVCLVVVKFSLQPVMALSCFALFLIYLRPEASTEIRLTALEKHCQCIDHARPLHLEHTGWQYCPQTSVPPPDIFVCRHSARQNDLRYRIAQGSGEFLCL